MTKNDFKGSATDTFLALLSEVKAAETIVPGISLGVHISELADSFKPSIVPVSITK